MIKTILNMLSISDFYGVSENIDIAKGKYAIPTTFKKAVKQVKRTRNGRKESN